MSTTRRQLLRLAGSGLVLGATLPAAEPENLSFPLGLLEGSITPPNRFFVRDHFPPAEIALESWQLRIEGRVEHPYEVTFSDLVEMPSRKIEAVLECAGNLANGSAVSNGIWEGVPLAQLIEKARPAADASLLLLEGGDSGRLFEHHPSLPYTRLVPLAKCLRPESLVSFRLNDQLLPAKNGFPARALFPGWYGMDSVKWLQRIVVLGASEEGDSAFAQSGMSRLYTRVDNKAGRDRAMRVSATHIKSVISWPNDNIKLPAGRHLIWGYAWGGAGRVRQVQVSTDAGKNWQLAKFPAAASPFAWVRWAYEWNSQPGNHVILSRAQDENGALQPLHRDPERKDQYELNWCAPLHCSVR